MTPMLLKVHFLISGNNSAASQQGAHVLRAIICRSRFVDITAVVRAPGPCTPSRDVRQYVLNKALQENLKRTQ